MPLTNKYLLFIACFVIFTLGMKAYAQKAYKITYNFKRTGFDDLKEQLIFNDSVSFSILSHTTINIEEAFNEAGKKRINYHSSMQYLTQNMHYELHYWPFVKRGFVEFNALPALNWVVSDSVKYFKGYRCKEAYTLLEDRDTLFTFFAADIPLPFGPNHDNGLPGVVFESYNQKLGHYLIATKIELINFPMQLPAGAIVYSVK